MVPGPGRGEAAEFPALLLLGSVDRPAPDARQRLLRFDKTLVIGRRGPQDPGPENAGWVVKDRMISSQHARISETEDGEWELTDLDSRNGTVVDGVSAESALPLRDGSLIFVGGHVAVFRVATEVQLAAVRAEIAKPLGPVATCNPDFATTCAMLRKLADTDGEVLLTGETGVGKEVYANAIHEESGRKGKFVAVNCAALPRELVESELFGYLRGAHSQATGPKTGIIEEAEGGTLFLDEIGDMAPELQTKLLRFTQDRMLTPVGGTRPRRIDVRILAATSRTAPPSAGQGGLRADLAARLGAEPVRIPPLRDRLEDLGALLGHLLGVQTKPFELLALQALCFYSWPGNVRELQKVLTTAAALSRGVDRIGASHLPQAIASGPSRVRSSPAGRGARPAPTPVELEELIRQCEGNMLKVARELDRKPALIYRWAKRFNIKIDDFRRKSEEI
ncbi:MAG: sigma 54-interacting transcriptional regulator [Deltaproteobacteria bacterium]|nr:sigma 54-interacting transcriptional regulator [Deltaproteobacteria bacterium]